jgi:peptide/nickel transport system permease protein
MLILLFAVQFRWFPVAGSQTFKHLILPAVTLGLTSSAVLARVTRAGMIEVLNNDYIRTARSKGVKEWHVNYRHALKNVLIPIVTILGLQLGGLLSGAIIVETVFGFAGIGQLAVYALNTRDYPVIQAVVLLTATGYVLANLLVDVTYAFVDPRIKY